LIILSSIIGIVILMETYITILSNIFTTANVCQSHGISHALAVLAHSTKALESYDYEISETEKLAVKLAGLLHDADDRKFFPTNSNYENLRKIIYDQPDQVINLTIRMVELVSSSANADSVPPDVIGKEWMLIPRFADRIEAIGLIGVERCYQYNKTKAQPLYLIETPKVNSEEEIWTIATEERYNSYVGKSKSMMCHYYDKLLRLGMFQTVNSYLYKISRERIYVTIRFVLYFSSLDNMTETDIDQWIEKEKEKV